MTETNPYKEQLQEIDPKLAREITRDSNETHQFCIFPQGFRSHPDYETVIEYRCTGYAAVMYVWIPRVREYAYHGDADDVWKAFEAEIQAEVNESSGKGKIIVEHNFGVRPPTAPEVEYPDNVSVSSVKNNE